jgi:DNA-binding HxlR family transcriptional regulator
MAFLIATIDEQSGGTEMIAIPTPPIASARNGLRLLRPELNRAILDALVTRPMSVSDLCAQLMLESDTTLREALEELEAIGAIEKQEGGQATAGEYSLTASGENLTEVMALTAAWLTGRPGRPLRPESDVAWRAVAAFADGWRVALIQHLLLRPSNRAELLKTIELSKEKLKRMLRRLQGAGLVTPLDHDDQVPRYALTDWGRRAIAVLIVVANWERAHLRRTAGPITANGGAIILLAGLPLVAPPEDASGICVFTIKVEPTTPAPHTSAVWARLENDRATVCRTGTPPTPPDAWVHGDVDAWIDAVFNARPTALHLGGDSALAEGALRGLHEELFGNLLRPSDQGITIP